jgi:hypothetical protein
VQFSSVFREDKKIIETEKGDLDEREAASGPGVAARTAAHVHFSYWVAV